eukprot:TRINITY_DN10786_c0_g1_i2.p3 TRINITY_DN10786_c0_g1~~TRINITY_DN10786_c0_g1_i2.p3  ORF type:complete len:102 (-),score=9.31 TRINITY_DN10786_c0_g1_i2:152-457(-)
MADSTGRVSRAALALASAAFASRAAHGGAPGTWKSSGSSFTGNSTISGGQDLRRGVCSLAKFQLGSMRGACGSLSNEPADDAPASAAERALPPGLSRRLAQ